MTSGFRNFISAGLVCLAVSASAWAILPLEGETNEITFPGDQFTPAIDVALESEIAAASPSWQEFTASLAPGWRAFYWNQAADIPRFMAGPPLAGLAPGAYDESQLEAHALRFAARLQNLIRIAPADLRFSGVHILGQRAFVFFDQYHQSLPVFTGRLTLGYFNGGVNTIEPSVYPDLRVNTTPVLSEAQAAEAARSGMTWDPTTDAVGAIRLGLLPIVWGTETACFLTYEVRFTTEAPAGDWVAYVDARDGDVYWRENHVVGYTIHGTARGDVKPRRADDQYQDLPMVDQKVGADGRTDYTDADGNFDVTVTNNQYYTVTDYNEGYWVRVYDERDGQYSTLTQTASPSDPAEFYWSDANTYSPERSCYYHTNVVHAWLKSVDPSFTGCDMALTCRVNVDCTCNGYWQGATINLCREGDNCNNIGEVADVIYHEYHHWVTYRTYGSAPPPTSTGLGEGFSDYCAMTISNDYCMAPSFFSINPDGCLRTGLNLRQYPGTECGGEEHCMGEITMGALWKTRRNLVDKHGEGFVHQVDCFFREAVAARATTIPNFLTYLLVANDDNGNLADGSPDYYEICDAWAEHNVDCPPITRYIDFTHTPLSDTENTVDPLLVRATITSVGGAGAILEDSTKVFYSTDGTNYAQAPLRLTGGSTYEGFIQPSAGRLIDYYLRSVTSLGIVGTDPVRAPGHATYRFLIGEVQDVYVDNLETDAGWTLGLPDDDATDGRWERVDPVGKQYNSQWVQPENDHTPAPGTRCLVTDGRGGYYTNYDVDAGKTSALSPQFDLSTAGDGYIDFYAFLATFGPVDDDSLMIFASPDGADWRLIWQIHNDGWNDPNFVHQKVYFRRADFGGSGTARFKVVAEDNENNTITEAAVDDFTVRATGSSAVAERVPNASVLWDAPPSPSPFSVATTIRFQNPIEEHVRISIFDVTGRTVSVLLDKTCNAGAHSVQWDGRSSAGRPVPSGVYYYLLRAGGQEITRPVVLMR